MTNSKVMKENNKNIDATFNVVNKRPRYKNRHEQQRKEDETRAELYQIYKKYDNDTNPRA